MFFKPLVPLRRCFRLTSHGYSLRSSLRQPLADRYADAAGSPIRTPPSVSKNGSPGSWLWGGIGGRLMGSRFMFSIVVPLAAGWLVGTALFHIFH